MKIPVKSAIIGLSIAFIVSACGQAKEASLSSHQKHAPNGDLQETTASADVPPTFLRGQSDQLRIVYAAAGKATDILKWMPCYCGCADSAGHASNLNCFVKEVKEDGSVVWDDHGTRCGVCVQIATESIKLKQQGKSLKEIRDYIDKTYEKGYAKPTKTPMPA